MMLIKLVTNIKEKKLGTYIIPYLKIISKRVKDLSVRSKMLNI